MMHTSNSSRIFSSAASGLTPQQTVVRIFDRACERTRQSLAICLRISISPRHRALRSFFRSPHRPGRLPYLEVNLAPNSVYTLSGHKLRFCALGGISKSNAKPAKDAKKKPFTLRSLALAEGCGKLRARFMPMFSIAKKKSCRKNSARLFNSVQLRPANLAGYRIISS